MKCWDWGCFPEAHGDTSARHAWVILQGHKCCRLMLQSEGHSQPSWSSRRGTPYYLCRPKATAQRDKVFNCWKRMLGQLVLSLDLAGAPNHLWCDQDRAAPVPQISLHCETYQFKDLQILLPTVAEDYDIVDVCSSQVLIVSEDMVHHPLKHHWCIAKTKWHHSNSNRPKKSGKRCFLPGTGAKGICQ